MPNEQNRKGFTRLVAEIRHVLLSDVHKKNCATVLLVVLAQHFQAARFPDAQAHPVDGLDVVETEEEQSNNCPSFY